MGSSQGAEAHRLMTGACAWQLAHMPVGTRRYSSAIVCRTASTVSDVTVPSVPLWPPADVDAAACERRRSAAAASSLGASPSAASFAARRARAFSSSGVSVSTSMAPVEHRECI